MHLVISMRTVGWFCYYQYFPLNSFCSTLVNDHREYFIWLLLPYFSDDKTIYFFFSEALASSCPQFSLYDQRFDFVSILQNGDMFEKLGDFFLFICPSLYRLETCSLFFLLFMLSLWNDLIDNWTIANKFTQFIWISTYFFLYFLEVIYDFIECFLSKMKGSCLDDRPFFSDAVIFRAKPCWCLFSDRKPLTQVK